jgi:hypothetical protein
VARPFDATIECLLQLSNIGRCRAFRVVPDDLFSQFRLHPDYSTVRELQPQQKNLRARTTNGKNSLVSNLQNSKRHDIRWVQMHAQNNMVQHSMEPYAQHP